MDGYAQMTQGQGTTFLRHAVLGRYAPVAQPDTAPANDTVSAPNTTLKVQHCLTPSLEIHSTGDCLAGPSGIQIAFCGQPYFRDAQLQTLASSEGTASALASAYDRFAAKMFEHVHGAFTCIVADPGAGRLLAAIDRLGQHSLYYQHTENGLVFGSSAGDVLNAVTQEGALFNQGIYNYLYFHMVPAPGTAYAGLTKLLASHYIEFVDNKVRSKCYWHPTFTEDTKGRSQEQASKGLLDALRTALNNTLPEQGKVGAFLSGGLDSSTVTGVMAELERADAQAYSIGFSAEGYDEMAFARITAEHFGVKLNEYYVTPQDVVDALPLIATSYDEPFGNSSALPAYFCASMAAQNGVDTLLAGDGGDEIFAGNERYIKQNVFEHYSLIPGPLRRGLIEPMVRLMPRNLALTSKANSYIAQANTPLPERMQSYNFLHRHAASEIFSEDFLAEVDTQQPIELLREIYHRPSEGSDLNRMLYLDWQHTLADNDLRKVSHMCALAGVDVVYPMLDDHLVDFSCTLPSKWKIKGSDLRHFYKRSLQGWLPDATINKNKQGFGLPFGVWMRTYQPLREMAYDNLLKLKQRGFVRPEFIDRTIDMHQTEHAAYYGELVWIFNVFELWLSGRT